MSEPTEPTYTQVNVFDGSIGMLGRYRWRNLPQPMTKKQAEAYCRRLNWCPPEGFRNGEPVMASKWMLDVRGKEEAVSGDYWLRTAVQKFLDGNYRICDGTVVFDTWHFGIAFKTIEHATACLAALTAKFTKNIADGVLILELKTWSASAWKE